MRPAFPDDTSKTKVGIMKFDVAEGLPSYLGKFLYDNLTEKVVNSGKVIVVDWEEIDRVLQYLSKSQPNLSPQEAKKQAINQLGITKMYIGSLVKVGSKYQMTLKVLNLDLSVERAVSESASSEDAMPTAMENLAKKLTLTAEEVRKFEEATRQEEAAKRAKEEKKKREKETEAKKRQEAEKAAKEKLEAEAREEQEKRDKEEQIRAQEAQKQAEQERAESARRRADISGAWDQVTVSQEGENVSVSLVGKTDPVGQVVFKRYSGTYSDGNIEVSASNTGKYHAIYATFSGAISDDGRHISGTYTFKSGGAGEGWFMHKKEERFKWSR